MKKVSLLVTIVFILTNLIVPSVNATISNSNKTVLENKVNEDIENLNSKEDLTIEIPENLEGINPEVDEEGESKEDSTEEVPESPEGISPEIDEEGESKEDSTEEVPESTEGINPEIDEDEESKEDSIVGVPEDSEESNPGVGEDEESKDDSIVEVPKNSELDKEESNDSSDKKYKIGDAYDMIQKVEPMMYRNNILENELLNKEEYIADYEAAINRDYLLNKTTSDFEIVLSHDKGGYTFFSETNSYDEAVNICKEFEVENDDKTIIPAIIDSDGVIVYSTNSMASFIKVVNGQVRYDQVTYLYQKSSLTGEANYINHNSIDDVPVIEDNGNAVKVLVNGYTGWVKKDTDSKNYDVIIVPMNKAINPSYYYEKNGELYHYISKDIAKSGGYHRSIGVAPNYMKSGVKYYSYDANYFYTDINTLINDLKRNSKTSAVNYSNKYYNYYTYLPLRSKTSYTANEINSFITKNTSANSKLRGIGQSLIDAQNKYGINAILMLGISINESGWGTSSIAMNKNNLFGLNAVDSSPGASANTFTSVKHCIDEFANYWMSKGYADPEDWRFFGGFLGNKDLGINVKYASDPFWGEKAASYAFQLDKQMSDNNINNMKDYNYYQLATYNAKTTVYTKNNKTLFSVSDYKYSADQEKVGVPVIVTNKNVKTNNGKKYTEIIPARTSQLLSSGSGGAFNGVYDWTVNGYVDNSKLTMINSGKNMLENLNADIIYNSNSEGLGWQGWQCDGEVSGTEGQSRQLEAIKIQLKNYKDASIQYSVHVEDIGWQTWKSDGEVAGFENGGKRIEAVKIKSSGLPLNLQVQYRVHVQNQGWQEWTTNGQVAGTEGKALRVEAIQIRVVEKQNNVNYTSNIENIGWQSTKSDGTLSGTTGESKRLEAIKIQLVNIPNATIEYRTHIQDLGWENTWSKNGEISGTTGKSKRMEAIQIRLKNVPTGYHVEYRTHIEGSGWENEWKRDGEISGTTGKSKRIEAIEIRIVKE